MLYFTIGLARSGKTTFSKRWAVEKPGRAVLDTDDLRKSLTGKRWCGEAELMVQAIKWAVLPALLKSNEEVLACGTHTSESSIRKILSIDLNAVPITIKTSVKECEERAEACGQLYLAEQGVIRRQFQNLKELVSANLVLEKYDFDDFFKYVEQAIEDIRKEYK